MFLYAFKSKKPIKEVSNGLEDKKSLKASHLPFPGMHEKIEAALWQEPGYLSLMGPVREMLLPGPGRRAFLALVPQDLATKGL